jgi:hypothetical protein
MMKPASFSLVIVILPAGDFFNNYAHTEYRLRYITRNGKFDCSAMGATNDSCLRFRTHKMLAVSRILAANRSIDASSSELRFALRVKVQIGPVVLEHCKDGNALVKGVC